MYISICMYIYIYICCRRCRYYYYYSYYHYDYIYIYFFCHPFYCTQRCQTPQQKEQACTACSGSAIHYEGLTVRCTLRGAPSSVRIHRGKSSPEQDARVKGRGRRGVVDDRRADREKKGKSFNLRGKVVDLDTG